MIEGHVPHLHPRCIRCYLCHSSGTVVLTVINVRMRNMAEVESAFIKHGLKTACLSNVQKAQVNVQVNVHVSVHMNTQMNVHMNAKMNVHENVHVNV